MSSRRLASLRKEIARTDRALQRALRRRIHLSSVAGRLKRATGEPLRDSAAERRVRDRWHAALASTPIRSERVDALVAWLIEESVAIQQREQPPTVLRFTPSRGRILVVGGLGQMGGWLREFFRSNGHPVSVADPAMSPTRRYPFPVHATLDSLLPSADVVVVATPMRQAAAVYESIWASRTRALVMDVLSFKAPIIPWIRRGVQNGFHVASAHPLFGPGTRALTGHDLLVIDCGDAQSAQEAAGLFTGSALRVHTIPLELHDKLISLRLALPHLVTLVFSEVLRASDPAPDSGGNLASTSFQRLAEVSALVTAENPELAFDIQTLNPEAVGLFGSLSTSLERIRRVVRSRDPTRYASLLRDAHRAVCSPDRINGPCERHHR